MDKSKKPKTVTSFEALGEVTGVTGSQPKKIIHLKSKTAMTANAIQIPRSEHPNLGWIFYRNYFKRINFSYITDGDNPAIEDSNARIITDRNNAIISNSSLVQIDDGLGVQFIEAKVAYPGLVTGIGVTHEAGVKGEFKLGLHIDYTFGMPIIHGSSVKGLLRSVFPDFRQGKDKHADSKLAWLIDFFKNQLKIDVDVETIGQIKNEIFEGKNKYGGIDIYNRDLFFDAIIIKADNDNRVMASDALAPHGKNPLKNPIPLPFLKISSGCTIQFRFDLKDSKIVKELTPKNKVKLFEEIIRTLGIGAKTNVGYGQFEE